MQASNEELAQLIQGGRDDLMLQLWEQVRGWAAKTAIRWHDAWQGRAGVQMDDLMQCAFLALVGAVETFDQSAGAFTTWYTFYLKTAFCDAYGIRTQGGRREPLNNAASLDTPISADDPDGNTLGDLVADPDGEGEYQALEDMDYNQALREALEAALNTIDPPCADAIRRRWFDGQTQQEIAESCGVVPQMIHNRERRGFSQLRGCKARKLLKDFNPYHGTGYNAWRHTGESIQERYLILQERYQRIGAK